MSKIGNFLSNLGMRRTENEDEAELLHEESQRSEPQATVMEEASLPEQLEDAACVHELKGALLQVWQLWAGSAFPPTLSLAGKLPVEALGKDASELNQARVRLTAQLEQDAKRRLKDIETAQKRVPDQDPESVNVDAFCRAYFSADKMLAWIFIFPPMGPEGALPPEAVGKALQEGRITTNIDTEAVVRIFQEKPYFELIPIAIGTPPVQGEDGSITELYERECPMEVKITEDGTADYRATNYVRQVEKDDVICTIKLPQPGTPGLRVDGKVVEPRAVRAARVPRGANTAVTEDGLELVATMSGHLEFSNDAFHVRPLLEVKGDVDYSVGNIDFQGDVHVYGDVRENFSIRATGTITVDGLVEAATVEAGGDLVITRGVVGDNRALLRSHGCVRVKYLENCVVYAGKCVFADCIMTSQIFSDDAVDVSSGRGSIIGGAITAARSIRAKMVGAQSGRRTELTLGILPYVQSELQNMKEDMEAIQKEKTELEKELNYLENSQGLEGSSAKLAKARMRKSVLGMKEQKLEKRREQLEPMTPDLTKCRLDCDIIYPVTVLTMQDATWTAHEVRRHCKVVYDRQTGGLKEIYY